MLPSAVAPEASVRVFCGDSRNLSALSGASVDLVVTSPPYWQLKDYGTGAQIGYGQSLHGYLFDLCRVWQECARILRPGRRLCINIGDQFARAAVYGRYKIIPIHAEIIAQCEALQLDFMGSIIWQKKTTMQTTGGAAIMGSFPHPPNGIVELDYEYILLFKKPGPPPKVDEATKRRSALTKEEWKTYFAGHWHFGGARQKGHEAMFPDELPRRLIRMFSFVGETVFDPFLGSGTTAKVALEGGRSAIGYELNPDYLPLIRERLGTPEVVATERAEPVTLCADYRPHVPDAEPWQDPAAFAAKREPTRRVAEVLDAQTLRLASGEVVRLHGIIVPPDGHEQALAYLKRFVQGKAVRLRFEDAGASPLPDSPLSAYVYLSNKIFVNRTMVRMGLAQDGVGL